jgi:hypothetical protein
MGGNLRWIAERLGPRNVAGVDVNEKALELLRERVPGADARLASGADLPFDDAALFKRDFGARYRHLFGELELLDNGFLSEGDGRWDDLTYWVSEKRG